MKKTLTILSIVIIAINSFAQHTTKQYKFMPDKKVQSDSKLKKPIKTEKSTNLNVIWEEHFDNYNTANTNGIPDAWEIISTATDTLNQWRVLTEHGDEAPEIGIPWIGASSSRDETLITPEFTVNNDFSLLKFDFSTSYYWFVQENSDDITVSISDDDFATETILWREDDSTMVVNSNISWPYYNWTYYTAKIDISEWSGSNVKIKFNFTSNDIVSTHGVSFYLDNISLSKKFDYDIAINPLNFFYDGGIYTLLPNTEIWRLYNLKASVYNEGVNNVTNCSFVNSLTNNNDTIFYIDTSYFVSGAQNLDSNLTDTFLISDLSELFYYYSSTGNYTYKQYVKCSELEQDTLNNVFSFPLQITDGYPDGGYLSRETRMNTTVSPLDYYYSTPGDEIGYKFMSNVTREINAVTIKISDDTYEGTTVRVKLYILDDNDYCWLLYYSDEYTIEQNDIGNEKVLDFDEAYSIQEFNDYVITIALGWQEDVSNIGIMAYNNYPNNTFYEGISKLYHQDSGNWYWIEKMPYIKLEYKIYGSLNETTNKNIKLYPNPTKGIVNIENVSANSSIKIYDMLGAELMSINNNINNIDISNLKEGTYLFKIYNNKSVTVKKVCLVK